MKKIVSVTVMSVFALLLAACGTTAGSSQSNLADGSSGANASSSGPSNSAPGGGMPAAGPSGLQLAAGMMKLNGTSNAVTPQEAAQLLPLWQSLQQMESTIAPQGGSQDTGTPAPRPSPAMMQQIGAQVALIQNALTPAQIQAITAMNLSRQDIFTAFQQGGISMGAPGQGGGGFRPSGGTFTPPQGVPPAARTPGAFQGNAGNFGGGRQGFGGFVPPSVVAGIIQFLQAKAGT